MEITPRFGQSSRKPMVATMCAASAASCSARVASRRRKLLAHVGGLGPGGLRHGRGRHIDDERRRHARLLALAPAPIVVGAHGGPQRGAIRKALLDPPFVHCREVRLPLLRRHSRSRRRLNQSKKERGQIGSARASVVLSVRLKTQRASARADPPSLITARAASAGHVVAPAFEDALLTALTSLSRSVRPRGAAASFSRAGLNLVSRVAALSCAAAPPSPFLPCRHVPPPARRCAVRARRLRRPF